MTTLAQYDRARSALAEATRIEQVLPLLDEIEHIKLHARQIQDRALLADASAFQMRAERRLGEVIGAAKEAGHFTQGKRKESTDPELSPRATLAEVGVDKKLSVKAQKAASISERAFEAMVQATREKIASAKAIVVDPVEAAVKESADAARKADHAARTYDGGKVDDLHALAASGFRAGAILADPPWHFVTRSDKGEGRSASAHYTTDRRWKDILELPVKRLAAEDATLHMWMVDWCPRLALDIIKAWGFAHKTTGFTWVKLTEGHDGKPRQELIGDGDFHFGMGYWTRANPEDCWLATRGSPKRINADVRQLIIHPVMEHSRKPDEIHDRIERLLGGPYLELYARRERSGWVTWGNELKFEMPVDAEGAPLARDQDTGEIHESEAQRDDTALAAAPARIGEEPTASAMSPCTQGDGATDQPHGVLRSPQNSDVDMLGIPDFLRRTDDARTDAA